MYLGLTRPSLLPCASVYNENRRLEAERGCRGLRRRSSRAHLGRSPSPRDFATKRQLKASYRVVGKLAAAQTLLACGRGAPDGLTQIQHHDSRLPCYAASVEVISTRKLHSAFQAGENGKKRAAARWPVSSIKYQISRSSWQRLVGSYRGDRCVGRNRRRGEDCTFVVHVRRLLAVKGGGNKRVDRQTTPLTMCGWRHK